MNYQNILYSDFYFLMDWSSSHLTYLGNCMHISIYHVNKATSSEIYLKKQVYVGNRGCLSSFPIRWLAWNDWIYSKLDQQFLKRKVHVLSSKTRTQTSHLHHQQHQQSYLQKKIPVNCENKALHKTTCWDTRKATCCLKNSFILSHVKATF
jgi:hypothetical protein